MHLKLNYIVTELNANKFVPNKVQEMFENPEESNVFAKVGK
jgi:hypothetical protein